MKVEITRGFVDSDTGWFMEPGMTAEYKAEKARKLEKEGLVKTVKKKSAKAE